MAVFIQGIGNVSAQLTPSSNTWHWHTITQNPAPCVEPNYSDLIAPMQLRRMSKAVRMGIAASIMALKDAGLEKPDTIITGTAYGCLADTEHFLTKLVDQEEQMLTPTAFIQSTHNTVSGQIALHLKCHGRNFTYTQRGHSFEHALQDAMLSLNEDAQQQLLVGAIDEISKHSFPIIGRFGTYKQEEESFFQDSKGTMVGEGAHMFVLNSEKKESSFAEIVDVYTCFTDQVEMSMKLFLEKNNCKPETCLLGLNGDNRYDAWFVEQLKNLSCMNVYTYKNYCGEQPIAASFAMMMAASMLRYGTDLPVYHGSALHPKTILIWNHYKNQYHSFILLRRS